MCSRCPAAGNAGSHAGQRKQSGASSICSSAASIATPGPEQTATSISTDRQSRYEGGATKPKEPAAQHARTASALSQGGCTSGTPPCMPLPLDNPRSSLTAVRPNESHTVVRQHPGSTAQLPCMKPTTCKFTSLKSPAVDFLHFVCHSPAET